MIAFATDSDHEVNHVPMDPRLLICENKMEDFEAVKAAAYECSRGVRWKQATVDYLNNINFRVATTIDRIKKEGYQPTRYNTFVITDPKVRKINSATLSDRIIQKTMCDHTLYHELTHYLNVNNAACQIGRGTIYATQRIKRHMYHFVRLNGTDGWVIRIDVKKFFDNISHGYIKAVIARRVHNFAYQNSLYGQIDSFKIPQILEPHRAEAAGIPLGSQLSQLYALNALDVIDDYVQRHLHIEHYIRYMDDIVIMVAGSYEDAVLISKLVIGRIECLGYEVNVSKTSIQPLSNGINFLHQHHHVTKTGRVITTIERSKFKAERRKLKRMFYDLHFKPRKNISLAIILRHYQGWRTGVILKSGNENTVRDMDWLFMKYMHRRSSRFIIGPTELEGLNKDFIRKFCSSCMKTNTTNDLFTTGPMRSHDHR